MLDILIFAVLGGLAVGPIMSLIGSCQTVQSNRLAIEGQKIENAARLKEARLIGSVESQRANPASTSKKASVEASATEIPVMPSCAARSTSHTGSPWGSTL